MAHEEFDDKEKIILKVVRRAGRLSYNKIEKECKKDMAPVTLRKRLEKLVEKERLIKQPELIGKVNHVFYATPTVVKFERKEIEEIERRYLFLNDLCKIILDRDYKLPKVGINDKKDFSENAGYFKTTKSGKRTHVSKWVPLEIKDQKEIDDNVRDFALYGVAEIIGFKSRLKTLLDLLPRRGKFSRIVNSAYELDKSVNLMIDEIKDSYEIKDSELFLEIKASPFVNPQSIWQHLHEVLAYDQCHILLDSHVDDVTSSTSIESKYGKFWSL